MNRLREKQDWRLAKCIARDVGLFRGPVLEYPPVLLWRPIRFAQISKSWADTFSDRKVRQDPDPLGVFVNTLFCTDQCLYCDYINAAKTDERDMDRYLASISRDIESLNLPAAAEMGSLYVSGGNLAALPPDRLGRLFELLHEKLFFAKGAPKTVGLSHSPVSDAMSRVLSQWGISRAVFQIQTLDRDFSRRIRRAVEPVDHARTWERLRAAGIRHIKVDWMVGLPKLPMEAFQRDLEALFKLRPDEIVVTPFHSGKHPPLEALSNNAWRPRLHPLDPGDVVRRDEMIRRAYEAVERYQQDRRERGNGGIESGRSSHREERTSMIGLGYGALSHIYGRLKYTRVDKGRGGSDHGVPVFFGMAMDKEREMKSYVIRNLMDRGHVETGRFRDIFGMPLSKALGDEGRMLVKAGLLIQDDSGWRTRGETLLARRIIAALLYESRFQRWFQDRRYSSPEDYARVDSDLVRLYGT